MDSPDVSAFDLLKGFEKCIRDEPDKMLLWFSQDDFQNGMVIFKGPYQLITVSFEASDLRRVVASDEKNLRSQPLFSFASFKPHLTDLL
jgi:hypothetical protein